MTRCLVVVLALWATVYPAVAQEKSEAEELTEVLAEMRGLRERYYAEKQQRTAAIAEARNRVTKLEADVRELEDQQRALEESTATLRKEVAELEGQQVELAQERSVVQKLVARFATVAREHVASSIPYRREPRAARIAGVEELSVAEAFGRLWSFFEEETRIARSGEAYTDEIELPDGRRKSARFLRVGKHILGFVTEDGVDAGLWRDGEGWVADAARVDGDAIRDALEILDRRRAPELVTLPVKIGGAR